MKRREFLTGIGFAALAPQALAGFEAPLFRVGLLTDTHITESPQSFTRVNAAMSIFVRARVGLICHLGDLADSYTLSGFQQYQAALEKAFGDRLPKTLYAFGGHDRNDYVLKNGEQNREETVWKIMRHVFKVSHELYDIEEYEGYPFVIIQEYMDYARASALIEKAVAEHPGKPVFVLMHEPAWGTIENSIPWGNREIRTLCNRHPQIVHLSGHCHGSVLNERNIWQGTFTEVNLGCLQNWTGMVGNTDVRFLGKRGDSVVVMDVYAKRLVFHRYSTVTGEEYRPFEPWTVPFPVNVHTVPYRPENRQKTSKAPVWPQGATVTAQQVNTVELEGYRIEVPEATHHFGTAKYVAALYTQAGVRVTCVEALGEYWKMPESARAGKVQLGFDAGLFTAGERYRFVVRPYDFWGNAGEAIACEIVAKAFASSWKTIWQCAEPLREMVISGHSWGPRQKRLAVDADGWFTAKHLMMFFDLPDAATLPDKMKGFVRLSYTLEEERLADSNWIMTVANARTDRPYGTRLLSLDGTRGKARYVLRFGKPQVGDFPIRLAFSYGSPGSHLRLTDMKLEVCNA